MQNLALLLICYFSPSLYARQSEVPDTLFTLSIEDLMKIEITISSKNEENIRNSPSSVTIFTQNEIEQLGLTNWTQLLNLIPGFYTMMNPVEGNQSHVIMRGHAQKYANTLLVLINGHRLNDDYTGGINYLIRYMNLALVSRVEVIRGPGSALYGSNAFNGVINIVTKNENNIEFALGEFNAKSLTASFAKEMSFGTIGASMSYSDDNGDQFHQIFDRNNIQTSTQDPRQVKQLRAAIENKNSQLFAQYLTSKRDDYYLFRRLRDNITEIQLKHYIAGINHTVFNDEKQKLDFSGSYQYAQRESLTALVPQGEPPFENADFLFGESFNYRSYGLALNHKYTFNPRFTLNSGVSYSQSQVPGGYIKSNFALFGEFEQLDKVTTFKDDDQRIILNKRRTISSAYLQSKLNLNKDTIFTLGFRYDGYNDVDNSITPRAAIIYHLDDQTFKLLYGQAYRAPSLGDLYDEESGLTIGNQNLKASEIETIEAVYIKNFEKLTSTFTLFSNQQKNMIGFRVGDDNNAFLDNVAANNAKGLEVETIWQASNAFQAKISYTDIWKNNTRTDMVTGLPLSEAISPKRYANFTLQYFYADWSLNLNGTWRNKVKVLNDDALWLLNTNLIYKFSDSVKATFTILNLLDEQYMTSSYITLGIDQQGNNVQQYPARGRQAMLGFSYRF